MTRLIRVSSESDSRAMGISSLRAYHLAASSSQSNETVYSFIFTLYLILAKVTRRELALLHCERLFQRYIQIRKDTYRNLIGAFVGMKNRAFLKSVHSNPVVFGVYNPVFPNPRVLV